MRYLVGEGRGADKERAEVHADPHLVGGEPGQVMLEYWGQVLDQGDSHSIAEFLDEPMNSHGVEVTLPVKDRDGTATGERRAGHVWHCSVSLHPDEPALEDVAWQELAQAYVARMGFARSESQAGCRWVAVRHGRSSGGNDHVHLVVNLVREDGTKASVHMNQSRAQQACRELEESFGLRQLESRGRGAGERGVKPAELSAAGRGAGLGEEVAEEHAPRRQLERVVRACSTAATDERDFVTRMRQEGILIRARQEKDDPDSVSGYSVALKPVGEERPVWFGGGRLSRELTLPRLRAAWPDPGDVSHAEMWKRSDARESPSRTSTPATAEEVASAARQLAQLRERLSSVPHDDQTSWALVARDTAGVLAALSLRTESQPGPLASAARSIARSAQVRAVAVPGRPHRPIPPLTTQRRPFCGRQLARCPIAG